jgi:hypothetical protein
MIMPSKSHRAVPLTPAEFTSLLMSGHPTGPMMDQDKPALRDLDGLPTRPARDPNKIHDPFKQHWADQGADDIQPDRDYPGRFRMPRNPHQKPRSKGPTNPAVQQLAQQIAGLMEQTKVGRWVREQINKSGWNQGGGSVREEMPDLDHLEPAGETMRSEDWNSHWEEEDGMEPVRTGR